MIERGEQFGMMVGALGEPVPIRVVALEPTTVLRLDYEEAMELTLARPDLRRLWLKTYAGSLRKLFFGAAPKRSAMMLALIHDSPATRRVAERLIQRLREVGEQLAVFSDSDQRRDSPNVRFRPLREDGRDLTPEEIRQQVAEWQDANRIIFDVHTYLTPERAARLMELVDRAVYFVPADAGGRRDPPPAGDRRDGPRLARQDQHRLAARGRQPRGPRRAGPRATSPPAISRSTRRRRDCPRAGRWPTGWSGWSTTSAACASGVALGGGAARGMSHLGVLKALEQQRHRRRHDRRHQRRRHDRHPVLLRPGPRLQRGCVRRGPAPLLDLPPPAAGQLLVPPVQVPPRAIRPDASQVPPRLEARTTRRPVPLRHGRPGERQLGGPRTRRRRPRDPREHQPARALRADRPQRPGADRRRAGQQHPGGRAGVDGLQLRDRRQRDGEDGDAFLRHHGRETDVCPGGSRASCRRSCAACWFRTTA